MKTWRERLAHGASPWEWTPRNFGLFVGVAVVLCVVVAVQQFLVASGASYVIAAINSAVLFVLLGVGIRVSLRRRPPR